MAFTRPLRVACTSLAILYFICASFKVSLVKEGEENYSFEVSLVREGDENHSRRLTQRHLIQNTEYPKADLRCATFGNTDTWGSMALQGGVRETSYAYQICTQVDNYGFETNIPNYASTCLESMLGNKVYDVITIDYEAGNQQQIKLGERLRRRFPKATILTIDRFQPSKVVMKKDKEQESLKSFSQRLGSNGPPGSKIDKALLKQRMISLEKHNKRLRKEKKLQPEAPKLTYRNSKAPLLSAMLGGIRAWPVYWGDEFDPEGGIVSAIDFYDDNLNFLNQAGHDAVANLIKETIYGFYARKSSRLGNFGDGDSCHLWYTTGETDLPTSTSVSMKKINKQVYGMEFSGSDSWVQITNRFSQPRDLYVTYETSPGPDITHSFATVTVDSTDITGVTLDTRGYEKLQDIISPRTVSIGKIPPGTHNVKVVSQDNGPEPFRLVGLTLAARGYEPTEYRFAPAFWADVYYERN